MTPSSTDPPFCSTLAPTHHQRHSWLQWLVNDERSILRWRFEHPDPTTVSTRPSNNLTQIMFDTAENPRPMSATHVPLGTQGSGNRCLFETVPHFLISAVVPEIVPCYRALALAIRS
ncbi:hypothetical protein diail_9443 [Diaporthe ilicicola]|nr:hypothetical protein diail_9443 [Diaporthe ilicicola]